jgi:hypothetical protein
MIAGRSLVAVLLAVLVVGCGRDGGDGVGKNPTADVAQTAAGAGVRVAGPTKQDYTIYYAQSGKAVDEESSSKEAGRSPLPLADMAQTKCNGIQPQQPPRAEFEKLFEVGANKRKIKGGSKLAEQFASDGTSEGYICLKDVNDNDKWTDVFPLDAEVEDDDACKTPPYLCSFTYMNVQYCRRC